MNVNKANAFIFTLANEIRRSYESPVILLTLKDYANAIFKSLVDVREALLDYASPDQLLQIVNTFHYQWLQAVHEIEQMKGRVTVIPREHIMNALEYTKTCVRYRCDYLEDYIFQNRLSLSPQENHMLSLDVTAIKNMQDAINSVLNEKGTSFGLLADQNEYNSKVDEEFEELLNWLDSLNNHLTLEFSKIVAADGSHNVMMDLSCTLKGVINFIAQTADTDAELLITKFQNKQEHTAFTSQINENDEEIRQVVDKINKLESRMAKAKNENSLGVMALQHKSMYLQEKLKSYLNLKNSLIKLKNKQSASDRLTISDYITFDHLLPPKYRNRLVEQLLKLWKNVVYNLSDEKSIISILSVADLKETFEDEIGTFMVDKHGRKVYRKEDNEEHIYQLNDKNELVAIRDDDRNVYFYDESGRYYIDKNNQRVYKADDDASEYILNHDGMFIKHRENRNGVEFWYDNIGMYTEDEKGRKIYYDDNSDAKYIHDGLGNLVRLGPDVEYVACPREPVVTEDSKYLQRTVGYALRKCIADVILRQPLDPILYLADSLDKYRINMQKRDNRLFEEVHLMEEREQIRKDTETIKSPPLGGDSSDKSLLETDNNFVKYESGFPTEE